MVERLGRKENTIGNLQIGSNLNETYFLHSLDDRHKMDLFENEDLQKNVIMKMPNQFKNDPNNIRVVSIATNIPWATVHNEKFLSVVF